MTGKNRLTYDLAEWVSSSRLQDHPPDSVAAAARAVMDFIRSAAVGVGTPWGAAAIRIGRKLGAPGRSTQLFSGIESDPAKASFVNGCLAHSADIDDTHVAAMLHPGASVIAAALAVAEERDLPGREFLNAVVVGYEVAVRVALAVQPEHFKRGFQATGTCNVFGAAAATGRLYSMDIDDTARSLGLAGSMAAGLAQFYFSGSEVKRIHAGRAAESAVIASMLVKEGIGGPPDVLEGAAGFAEAYAGTLEPQAVRSGLGQDYCFSQLTTKLHATSARIQAAVECGLQLGANTDLMLSEIASVSVGIPPVIAKRLTNPAPEDISSAQMSMPFSLALAMVAAKLYKTQTLQLRHYRDHLNDSLVRALAMTVECLIDDSIDPSLGFVPASVSCRTVNGHVWTASVSAPLGSPARPLSDVEFNGMFVESTSGIIDEISAAAVLRSIEHVESVDSVRQVITAPLRVETQHNWNIET